MTTSKRVAMSTSKLLALALLGTAMTVAAVAYFCVAAAAVLLGIAGTAVVVAALLGDL